jgi:hypothetical protein
MPLAWHQSCSQIKENERNLASLAHIPKSHLPRPRDDGSCDLQATPADSLSGVSDRSLILIKGGDCASETIEGCGYGKLIQTLQPLTTWKWDCIGCQSAVKQIGKKTLREKEPGSRSRQVSLAQELQQAFHRRRKLTLVQVKCH